MRILLAEDERALSRALVRIFELHNLSVDAVYDGEDALGYLLSGDYDAAVLDIMMPKLDGLSVLKRAREHGCHTPILLLTAKSDIEDRVIGLDSGANDYLSKPFDSRELLARIRAMTRTSASDTSRLVFGNVTLDRTDFSLSTPSGVLRLTNREFQMMELLMSNPHMLISVDRFYERIWGLDNDTEINVVWVYISYLRKKLTTLDADIVIRASRNAGYSLALKSDDK